MPIDDMIITAMVSLHVHGKFQEMWVRVQSGIDHRSMILSPKGIDNLYLKRVIIHIYVLFAHISN